MQTQVQIGSAWDTKNDVMLGVVLEMLITQGRLLSNQNACHYVTVRRGDDQVRQVKDGYWGTYEVVEKVVKVLGRGDHAVAGVRYDMKVADSGSVHHWMELT